LARASSVAAGVLCARDSGASIMKSRSEQSVMDKERIR
jgi:hypothetical protein